MQLADISVRQSVLQREFRHELVAIADWWVTHAQDREYGGFYGELNEANAPAKSANKGIILNTRILWFFSEVAMDVDNPDYRSCAQRAYDYLVHYFFDAEHGGVYWELDAAGNPLNTKKQVYAQAFTIYALCAYYQLTKDESALKRAMECFELIEQRGIDRIHEGYLEAFTREWGVMDDLRLSEKDLNFPKSQNTHLHIMEAYTSLHAINPEPKIKAALRYTIELFDKYMIDKETHHLRMFMDLEWKDFSPGFTYGHDIEAAWLIARALESLDDRDYTAALTPSLLAIAEVTLQEAIGAQGQVMDSYDFTSRTINTDAVWWVQAEALVGFLYAYEISGQKKFFSAAENVWQFTKTYQIDHHHGEWLWLSTLDKSDGAQHYKAGFWKCPYHNGRAMIEASRYMSKL